MTTTLDRLARILAGRPPREVHDPARGQAAVALVLAPGPDRLLLIRRAERSGDPWSGHLALPGGRREPSDPDLLATALRETEEEVGFRASPRHPPVQLDDLAPSLLVLPAIVVRPWLLLVEAEPQLQLSEEVAATAWVPLERLLHPGTRQEADVETRGAVRRVPGYRLEEGFLWGMTERIVTPIVELWREVGRPGG